jgi:hypothetical protein
MPIKKLYITLILIVFSSNIIKAQDQSKRSSTIRAFISAVFKEKKETRFIIDNYMFLPSNDTISPVKKEVAITHMIDTLVKANNKILASSDYKIFEYDNFKGDKKIFNTDDHKDILVLSVKSKAIIYFYFSQERINSFFVIEKGSLSFFLTI